MSLKRSKLRSFMVWETEILESSTAHSRSHSIPLPKSTEEQRRDAIKQGLTNGLASCVAEVEQGHPRPTDKQYAAVLPKGGQAEEYIPLLPPNFKGVPLDK